MVPNSVQCYRLIAQIIVPNDYAGAFHRITMIHIEYLPAEDEAFSHTVEFVKCARNFSWMGQRPLTQLYVGVM